MRSTILPVFWWVGILDELTVQYGRYDPASKALTPDHDNFMIEDDMQMMIGDE